MNERLGWMNWGESKTRPPDNNKVKSRRRQPKGQFAPRARPSAECIANNAFLEVFNSYDETSHINNLGKYVLSLMHVVRIYPL